METEYGRWYDNGDGTVTRYNEDGTSDTRDRNDPEVVNAGWDEVQDQAALDERGDDLAERAGDERRDRGDWGDERRAREAEQARWDAMSWEERQEARGRGESRPTWDDMPGYGGGGVSDFDRTSADIPLWGDLSGARGRLARSEADREAARRAAILGDLAEFMPTEDELSVEYGNEDMIGPGADSLRARDAFAEWSEGGFTDADRAMMDESRRRAGMTARADREASLSALEARGMGGSGASLAASLAAGEGAADRGASMDASMMGAAQQRQYNATGALAEFGAREDDYSRGREGRNTDRENRTRESAAEAAQRAHENRSEYTSFALGGDPNARDPNAEEDEGDEAARGILSGLGEWISNW